MIKYRADIDGLRAIAVLLVVLYHAKFPVSGGFIGVDVFFVISGFLITMIMDKEIREGSFTYSSFYTRRIKRLVPAFAFMLAILFFYCSYYLMPEDLLSFSKSAMLSLFGVSNFYFFFNTNYFDSSVSEPLLHTWSLSVEEQFYIFWPFILMAIYKSKKSSVKATIFATLFISSLMASQYYAINSKNMAYMMLPFRFFELMTGAIVAIKFRTISQVIGQYRATPFIGLGLILASAFWLNDESVFPGLGALPACVGAAILLSSGFSNRLLTCSPVVYVGKVSYSWYLWHWPFLILAVYRDIQLTPLNASALVLGSFLMASVSYHFVEQPFRRAKLSFPQAFGFIYALPVIVACVFLNAMYESSGWKSRMDGMFDELTEENTAHVIRKNCMDTMKVGNISECHLGVEKKIPDVLMIGDSFGNAYTGFVDVLAKDAGVMVHDTMRSATPSIPDVFVSSINNKWPDGVAKRIIAYNNERTAYAYKFKTVIISDFFDQYDDRNKSFRVYDKDWHDVSPISLQLRINFLKSLLEEGIKVIIIARPYDRIGGKGLAKLRAAKMRHADLSRVTFPYGENKGERDEYKIKRLLPGVIVVDPNKLLCSNGLCKASLAGGIIFRKDGSHLNYSSSEELGREYLRENKNPLL